MSDIDTRVKKLEDDIKSIMARPTYASTPAWHQEVAELRLQIEEIRSGRRPAHSANESLPVRPPQKPAPAAAPAMAVAAHAAVATIDDDGGVHEDHGDAQYMVVFAFLTIFTLIELGLGTVFHGIALALGLTAFAMAKVVLVALYYMHLRWEKKIIHALLTIPIILVVIMVVLLIPDAKTVVDGFYYK